MKCLLFARTWIIFYTLLFCFFSIPSLAQPILWPKLSLPSDIHITDESVMRLNGIPIRMQIFISDRPAFKLLQALKEQPGEPLVVSTWKNTLILGRSEGVQGEYYLTIQLEPTVYGTKGIIGLSYLQEAFNNQSALQNERELSLSHLPAGSHIHSQLSSEENNTLTKHFTISNHQTLSINQHYITRWLQQQGMSPEQPLTAPLSFKSKKILFFKGPGKEAIVTLNQNASDHTIMVLNTTSTLEKFK